MRSPRKRGPLVWKRFLVAERKARGRSPRPRGPLVASRRDACAVPRRGEEARPRSPRGRGLPEKPWRQTRGATDRAQGKPKACRRALRQQGPRRRRAAAAAGGRGLAPKETQSETKASKNKPLGSARKHPNQTKPKLNQTRVYGLACNLEPLRPRGGKRFGVPPKKKVKPGPPKDP